MANVEQLPVLYARRLDAVHERTAYVARPGLSALPSGTGALFFFMLLQWWTLSIMLWALWWPTPQTRPLMLTAIAGTVAILGALGGVVWMLLRQYPGVVQGVLRAPFIRLTVTDQRVLWTLPWSSAPLMQIGRERILGAILGTVDARGRGNAAMILVPDDPAADVDGNIHFDRLPEVETFVAALAHDG